MMRCMIIFSASLLNVCAYAINFPRNITLRAGVIVSEPFLLKPKKQDEAYSGFMIDFIEKLKISASNDNVTLDFILGEADTSLTFGKAFDMIASDCSTNEDAEVRENCGKYDLIAADYFVSPERAARCDMTPPLLTTSISNLRMKHTGKGRNIGTITELERYKGTACVLDGTLIKKLVMAKHPDAQYYSCSTQEDCVRAVKGASCTLWVDDELLLTYTSLQEPGLFDVSRENILTQYIVWPMSPDLDSNIQSLLQRWVYTSIVNGDLTELYVKYFTPFSCPIGSAGDSCDKFCDPTHGTGDRRGKCVCESQKWTGDNCSVEVAENKNYIPTGLKIAAYSMFGIIALIIPACFVWMTLNSTARQVKCAQPFFLSLVLLGCLISSTAMITLAQEDRAGSSDVLACPITPWLYSIGFCIVFGSLLAKVRRAYIIFTNALHFRKVDITIGETCTVVGIILFVDVTILLAWTISDPLHWVRTISLETQFGEPLSSQGYCRSDNWVLWICLIGTLHFAILGASSYYSYVSWNLPPALSGAKQLQLAVVSNLQIYLLGVPVLFLVGQNPDSSFFVRSTIIWINNMAVISLIFGNLILETTTDRSLRLTEHSGFSRTRTSDIPVH